MKAVVFSSFHGLKNFSLFTLAKIFLFPINKVKNNVLCETTYAKYAINGIIIRQRDEDDEHLESALHSEGLPGSSAGKEFACNTGDPGLIPGSGRSTGEEIGYPLQYS